MGTLRGLRATILYIGLGAQVCSRLSDGLACLPTSHPSGGRRVGRGEKRRRPVASIPLLYNACRLASFPLFPRSTSFPYDRVVARLLAPSKLGLVIRLRWRPRARWLVRVCAPSCRLGAGRPLAGVRRHPRIVVLCPAARVLLGGCGGGGPAALLPVRRHRGQLCMPSRRSSVSALRSRCPLALPGDRSCGGCWRRPEDPLLLRGVRRGPWRRRRVEGRGAALRCRYGVDGVRLPIRAAPIRPPCRRACPRRGGGFIKGRRCRRPATPLVR